MKMKMKPMLAVLLAAVSIQAATETHTVSIPSTFTDWTNTIAVPQFNPVNGTLTAATLSVAGSTVTHTWIENTDSIPWVTTSGSTVTLSVDGLFTGTETTGYTNSLGAFDGVVNFAGTSGVKNPDVTQSITGTAALVPASVTGTGTFPLTVHAEAKSFFDGPGDYSFVVYTKAAATVTVTYTFTPICPSTETEDDDHSRCSTKPFYCLPAPKSYGCRRP